MDERGTWTFVKVFLGYWWNIVSVRQPFRSQGYRLDFPPTSQLYDFNLASVLARTDRLLDSIALYAWRWTVNPFRPAFLQSHNVHSDFFTLFARYATAELEKRAIVLKESSLSAVLVHYLAVRRSPESLSDAMPPEWESAVLYEPPLNDERQRPASAYYRSHLSGSQHREGHFDGCNFLECNITDCDFTNARFPHARFIRCQFTRVVFRNARFTKTEFEGCTLREVDFSGAMFEGAMFWYPLNYERVKANAWTTLTMPLAEERSDYFELVEQNTRFYREMFRGSGLRRLSSELRYKQEAAKEAMKPPGTDRLLSAIIRTLIGHGERPLRFIAFAGLLIMLFGSVYWRWDLLKPPTGQVAVTFWQAIYFSVVTFTTLGSGEIVPRDRLLPQALTICEVGIGVIAVAIVTALVIRQLIED